MQTLEPAWKRIMDLTLALAALVVLAPVMLFVGFLVRWKLGSPVFFKQVRTGLGGRLFQVLKFRTMAEGCGPDSMRLTKFGARLRSTSLDELPQLLNVVAGDMSLVGPRPLLPAYLPRYSPFQARRHEVRPGVTGWAQVNGRNAISWERRFELDVWYVDHQSFWLDVRIIGLTCLRLIRPRGVSAGRGEVTMSEFMGSQGDQRGNARE
jgi:sugar transferase EpsL